MARWISVSELMVTMEAHSGTASEARVALGMRKRAENRDRVAASAGRSWGRLFQAQTEERRARRRELAHARRQDELQEAA